MALRVVGAGLGRTGTNSLKLALEQLLDGRCYHMFEAAARPQDTPLWSAATRGDAVDWDVLLGEYVAAVDWPACAFWQELSADNPDALVLLSSRDSPEAWWASMEGTIVRRLDEPVPADEPDTALRRAMILELMRARFTPSWRDRDSAISAYERHNETVRRGVPAGRLIEWRPGDGWQPICEALHLPVPEEPFPHVNTTADFRSNVSAGVERSQASGSAS
jgi:hypothetical protein